MPTLLVKYPKLFIMVSLCVIGEDYILNFKDYNHGSYMECDRLVPSQALFNKLHTNKFKNKYCPFPIFVNITSSVLCIQVVMRKSDYGDKSL